MLPRVDFVLPGLFDLPLQELDSDFLRAGLPHLNRLLSLGITSPNRAFSIDAILLGTIPWNSPSPLEQGLPIAQAFARPKAQDHPRYLLFQAIHLKPDMANALILPIESSPENLIDIDIIIKDLAVLFKVDCDVTAIADGVYLMQLHNFDAPLHYPHVLSVLGKSAGPYIEQSREILVWHKLLNEMQMFLHQHEVNQNRLQSGLLPLNSLWFWGAGTSAKINPGLSWYSDDYLLNRFAQSLDLTPKPVDALDLSNMEFDSLVVDLRLIKALKSGQGEPLSELLLDIDNRLFKPMLDSVGAGRSRLMLRAGFRFDFEMRPLSRFKFWKGRSSLIDWQVNPDVI